LDFGLRGRVADGLRHVGEGCLRGRGSLRLGHSTLDVALPTLHSILNGPSQGEKAGKMTADENLPVCSRRFVGATARVGFVAVGGGGTDR